MLDAHARVESPVLMAVWAWRVAKLTAITVIFLAYGLLAAIAVLTMVLLLPLAAAALVADAAASAAADDE